MCALSLPIPGLAPNADRRAALGRLADHLTGALLAQGHGPAPDVHHVLLRELCQIAGEP